MKTQALKVKAYIITIQMARQTQINLNSGWTPGLIESPEIAFVVQLTDLSQEQTLEEINSQLYSLLCEGLVEVTITPAKEENNL